MSGPYRRLMSRSRDTSLWDVANAGMNAYNARQTSKLRKEMAEQNAMLHSELEQMRMSQELERMKKEMIIQSRNLILDLEDELNRIEAAFPKYPAHSSLTFDLLENMFESSGIESNLFEEIHDIERFRHVQKRVVETSATVSKLAPKDVEVKANLIRYTTEEEELQGAIRLAIQVEDTTIELEENSTKWKKSQDEWNSLMDQVDERREKFNTTVMWMTLFGLLGIGAAYAVMTLTTDMLDSAVQEWLWYLFGGLAIIILLFSGHHKSNPIVGERHPLRLLRDSIPELREKMDRLNSKFGGIPNVYDGISTSEGLKNLHTSWLQFVDEHSPEEGEVFETLIVEKEVQSEPVLKPEPAGPPKKNVPRGPPKKRPPADMKGEVGDDGFEWLEYPEDSDKWFYRESDDQPWDNWRG